MIILRGAARSPLLAHGCAVCGFALLAVALSWPLALHLGTAVPGAGPGDNLSFVWNFWWFRQAWADPRLSFFQTPFLFAPFGTSLILHTHTALEAAIASAIPSRVGLLAAHNLVLLSGLTANGAAAYALAFRESRRPLAAFLAGVMFASSSFVSVHLLGHFNLVHAWGLPVAALAWLAFEENATWARGVMLAAAFTAVTYTDYYFLVFSVAFVCTWTFASVFAVRADWNAARLRQLQRALLALAAAALCGAAFIALSGGFRIELAGRHVSARSTRNAVAAASLLLGVAALIRASPRISWNGAGGDIGRRSRGPLVLGVVLYTIAILPLISGSRSLAASGDYVVPHNAWRSAPAGVDLATVALGNPYNWLTRGITQAAASRLDINLVEQTAWPGVVAFLLAFLVWRRRLPYSASDTRWVAIGVVFLIWAAGPFVTAFGVNTGVPLPQGLLRYVPIVSNARIPGRAMVMVHLAVAILAAIVVARAGWRRAPVALLIGVALIDGLTTPFPVYTLRAPGAVERAIEDGSPAANVLELPLGLRDGFRSEGRFDERALAAQTAHGRPLVGGFVARLSPRITDAYRRRPVLAALLDRAAPRAEPAALPADLAGALRSLGIWWVVLNTDADPGVTRSELEAAGLALAAADGPRELFAVPGR